MSKHKRIEELENENAEYAKEILLNESAIYEAERELSTIETDILDNPKIQNHIQFLKLIVERIKFKNDEYRKMIFQNNFEINQLENEND